MANARKLFEENDLERIVNIYFIIYIYILLYFLFILYRSTWKGGRKTPSLKNVKRYRAKRDKLRDSTML